MWSIREVFKSNDQRRFEDHQRNLEVERHELAGLYEDETTWLAETLNGSMRSKFSFRLLNGELTASDGRQLRPIFENSKARAQALADKDPRMQAEIGRTETEWEEFLLMDLMAHDHSMPNTVVVHSAILDGLKDDAHGYQVSRGLGWSRIITRNDTTGEITIVSQSLDGDERQAYNAIYGYFDYPVPAASTSNNEMLGVRIALQLTAEEQAVLPDTVMGVYDTVMDQKFGGQHRAGRQQTSADTWQFTLSQADLIKDHMERIAPLVLRQKHNGHDKANERHIKAIRYGTAAALKRRYELGEAWTSQHPDIAGERDAATGEATAAGESFNGCGFEAKSGSAEEQVESLGYGLKHKVKGPCPFCRNIVEYDPCDPKCSECGPYGNDAQKYRKAMGQKALQARRKVYRQKVKNINRQPVPRGTISLPNGSEVIIKEKLIVGGTTRYFEEKTTGRIVEAAHLSDD